jgi:acetyl esterase/lipase
MKKPLIVTIVSTSSLFALSLAQMAAPAYPADLKPSYADVPYASVSKNQNLDLFVPSGNGPFPVVINIHGGGFRLGSKEMLDAPIARELLKAGIAVASINYRLSGEAKFPAAVQDAKAAVRYLRANASKLKLNRNKFLAFGQSAGGNLASLLGTSAGFKEFDDPKLGNAFTSSRVQGVVDWFGPTDFLQMDEQAKAQGCPEANQVHGKTGSPETAYMNLTNLTDNPTLVAKANPISYIDRTDPPFLLQKGDLDCTIAIGQSQLLFEALKAGKVPVQFDLLKGAGHGDMGLPAPVFSSPSNVARVIEFMKTTLK